jgi:hypothetical protein
VTEQPDLARYLQRRRLQNYEQGMARLTYAYGVDVRRSRWLAASTIGNSLVRAVDRRWPALTEELMADDLRDPGPGVPMALLERIGRLRHLLRAPLPALRVLTPAARASGHWPLLTPLGPTHGDIHWLILDLEGLAATPTEHLDFSIGSALGHLQCDHGVYFTAHLLAARREGLGFGALRRALAPWSRVMIFSADRAGMLAAGHLSTALGVLRARAERDAEIAWLPRWPALEVRERALEEFDRSVVMARIRAVRARVGDAEPISVFEPASPSEPEHAEASPPPAARAETPEAGVGIPADAWSLARCDARLTQRLGLL